jgi:hypothetical protein
MGEGILSVLFGGVLILIALQIILGFAGLNQHDSYRAWVALSVVWAPWLFIRFGRKSD